MPIIKNSDFKPGIFKYTHIQTTFPTLFRKVEGIVYKRERINTQDDDFLDLDFSTIGSDSVIVLCHGLEGCSDRAYMKGMAKAFHSRGVDAVCLNYRGCSGETNIKKRTYNAGATDDLHDVINYIIEKKDYKNIFLSGFSLGANLILKYAGEKSSSIDSRIKGLVAVSAPCSLKSSCMELLKAKNFIYHGRFLKQLINKIEDKIKLDPELARIDLSSVKDMIDFDNLVTAPLNGYKDADDYWSKCSANRFLSDIKIPALIINAADDTILGPECYPHSKAENSDYVFLEIPKNGGHVGFMKNPSDIEFWHETRAVNFIRKHTGLLK